MSIDDQPQFGSAISGVPYVERPGAYAVAIVGGRVLVVETLAGLYLPGGGVAPGETVEAAPRREVREETGREVVALARRWVARQIVGLAIVKVETFFVVTLAGEPTQAAEADHRPRWVGIDEALAGLAEEAQCWAVRRAWAEAIGREKR